MDECRLCGSEEGFKVNIFEPDSDYVKKIHKILPITINEHDPLPKTICHRCSYKVNEFFEFRSKCIDAQELFKRRLPWARDKQVVDVSSSQPPMVVLPLSTMNSMSPNDKQLFSNRQSVVEESEPLVISDDEDESNVPKLLNGHVPQSKIIMKIKRAEVQKRPKARSMWDTRKRKRRLPQMECRITEVFTDTNADLFENNYGDTSGVENDPLYISSTDKIENSKNFSYPLNNSQVEVKAKQKRVNCTEEKKTAENTNLSKYFLVTKLPQGESVYTCKECARTFVSSKAATGHVNDSHGGMQNGRLKEKEEEEEKESLTTYECAECGQLFSRQSQLASHSKKHLQAGGLDSSSSDERFTPFNRRRRKPKRRPQHHRSQPSVVTTTQHHHSQPSVVTTPVADDATEITRHSLLSSDSE